ncbi:MAG: DUF177 domain-containing protein [Flavobacteriales bacterium]|nr:DUF177 domain-containing protein [Flavobacteriales bacterium]
MEALKEHSIPFTGLKDGQHRFDFVLGQEFFDAAHEEELTGGQAQVVVTLDKTPTLLVAGIHVEGTVATTCDRCNSSLDLPVTGEQQQIFQLHGEADPDDDEVVVLAPQEHSINLSHYIYECLRLALPARRVHPPGQCDPEVEAVLGHLAVDHAENLHVPDPRWDALKQLKNK